MLHSFKCLAPIKVKRLVLADKRFSVFSLVSYRAYFMGMNADNDIELLL